MKRAYSTLTVKAVEGAEERIIEGVASTPTPDRAGDIVESTGAKFSLPLAFLWQHQHDKPVGVVESATVTDKGISFRARLAEVKEPGALRDRIEEAWQSIKAGLVRGVSIGFNPIEYSFLKDGDGIRFSSWEWLELSLVTIPANAEASIQTIKSIDRDLRAATGRDADGAQDITAASGDKPKPIIKGKKKMAKKQTLAEQISAFKDTRVEKAARMSEIVEDAEGSTLDASQQEEFDALEAEIDEIDSHVKRLRTLEKAQIETARPVENVETAKAASDARGTPIHAKVKAAKPAPGIQFARLARLKALSAMDYEPLPVLAERHYGRRDPDLVTQIKANVTAHSTVDADQGGFLVGDETGMFADFVSYLRPMTILGRFGQGGVPSLRTVPFRVALLGQTTGGEGYWVGEGKPKPLTAFEGERNTLTPLKVANIAVATMELLRDSSPSAEAWLRDQLAAALQARLDTDFIDPSKTASTGVSPASITNGASAIASTGVDADAVRLDIRAVFQKFIDANNAPTQGVWIMSNTNALALSLMLNPLGQSEFPGMTMTGGTLQGLPVITSQYAGTNVALVNASDVYFADDGGIAVDFSREASLQMLDNPTNDVTTPTATTMVSMFQTNSVAFRAERTLNWARRRVSSVVYLTGVAWGGAVPAS